MNNKKRPYLFYIVFTMAIFGLVKIFVSGESHFRSAGPYTAQTNPAAFWFDVGLLGFFAIASLLVILSSIWKK